MNNPETADPDAFWDFALDWYGRPGVAAACLDLQDRDGADVNLLLLCLYAGQVLGRALSTADLTVLRAAVQAWNAAVVHPLRGTRRALKTWAGPEAAGLRQDVAAAELAAERQAQRLLLAALPPGPTDTRGLSLAADNLTRCAGPAAGTLIVLVTARPSA